MKINDGVRELWKSGFFEKHNPPINIRKKLKQKYGMNPSNITMNLKSCKSFLRKEQKGWIQKIRFGLKKVKKVTGLNLSDITQDQRLKTSCKTMFDAGDYWKAVLHAFIHLEVRIRQKSRLPASEYGKELAEKAFKPNVGSLKIPSCATSGEEDGFKNIIKGMMMFHRNAKAHREETIDRNLALKIIGYIDYLLIMVDNAKQRNFSPIN